LLLPGKTPLRQGLFEKKAVPAPRNRVVALETAQGLFQTRRVHSRRILKHLAEGVLDDSVGMAVFVNLQFSHGEILVRRELAQSLGDDFG
jgi:hypothetical protein